MVKELNIKEPWSFEEVLDWFRGDKIAVSKRRIEFSHPSYSEALEYLLIKGGRLTRINRDIFSRVLIKLSKWNGAPRDVIRTVLAYSDKLPENARNLLFKLSERYPTFAASALAGIFRELSEDVRSDLLLKLSEMDEVTGMVAQIVSNNFGKIKEDTRNKILLKFLETDETAETLIWTLINNLLDIFDKCREDIRNELLIRLSEINESLKGAGLSVAPNFDNVLKSLVNKCKEREPQKPDGNLDWVRSEKDSHDRRELERLTRSARIRILPGYVFRRSKPAIVGIEVLAGEIRPKVSLFTQKGKDVGRILQIQDKGEQISLAGAGVQVAVSIDKAAVGRQFNEGDILYAE